MVNKNKWDVKNRKLDTRIPTQVAILHENNIVRVQILNEPCITQNKFGKAQIIHITLQIPNSE